MLRTERFRWWKGLLGIVLFLVGFFLLSALFGTAGIIVDLVRGDVTPEQFSADQIAEGVLPMGPGLFIGNNLALAGLIPLSVLVNRLVFGQRGGWLSSVSGRFRWRWLAWCLLAIGLPWLVAMLVELFVAGGVGATVVLSTPVLVLLVLMLVTTPLQAAGEEWGFRGFIPRCIAAMVPNAKVGLAVAAVLSSALFMVSHLAQDPWLNVFYFFLALVFMALTWRTGGLEAAVVLHAVNNVVALTPVILTDQLGGAMDRSAGVGNWTTLLPIVLGIALVFVAGQLARRRGIARVSAPGLAELQAPRVDGAAAPGSVCATDPEADTSSGTTAPHTDSDQSARRVTLDVYEHRDDPQHGADDRP